MTGFTQAKMSAVNNAKGKRRARAVIETVCSKRVGRGRFLYRTAPADPRFVLEHGIPQGLCPGVGVGFGVVDEKLGSRVEGVAL